MRNYLLPIAAALALFATAAEADNITLTASVDGGPATVVTSANGSLNITGQSFGPFNNNDISANSQSFLAAPGILNTNTLNVNQTVGGNHTLIIDILAEGLIGPNALTGILNEFSVTGMTTGWSAFGETFINGVLQVTSPTVTANSALGSATTFAFLTDPFSAEVRYTINSVGTGQFNGGINMSAVAAVPGPIAGAGLPGLLAAFGIGLAAWKKRRRNGENLPAVAA